MSQTIDFKKHFRRTKDFFFQKHNREMFEKKLFCVGDKKIKLLSNELHSNKTSEERITERKEPANGSLPPRSHKKEQSSLQAQASSVSKLPPDCGDEASSTV